MLISILSLVGYAGSTDYFVLCAVSCANDFDYRGLRRSKGESSGHILFLLLYLCRFSLYANFYSIAGRLRRE